MEVVDQIRWIPDFGYERELDWLLQHARLDDQQEALLGPGAADLRLPRVRPVRRHRRPRGAARAGGRGLGRVRGPHAAPAVRRRGDDRLLVVRRARVERIKDVGNPWLDAGIVPFSTLHFREDPEYWAQWFPADFITESFPGQFRNWFYSMLAMSTVLRREPPFKTIFGYATLFGEDGRPMHKSWGNAIEFDEAAERMGVDVMRWMFAKARPEDNILLRLARRRRGAPRAAGPVERVRVLRDLRAPRRLDARRSGRRRRRRPSAAGARPLDPVARGRHGGRRSSERLADFDALGGDAGARPRSSTTCRPGTCAARGSGSSRRRRGAIAARRVRHAPRGARRRSRRMLAPILPFLAEAMYQNLVDGASTPARPTAST